ncbi:MAG: zinc metalloprotease HtpX [Proteobacteria bacterium]|nr:zinc metalloprotease HtpX [Pseudomonadota bacterium]
MKTKSHNSDEILIPSKDGYVRIPVSGLRSSTKDNPIKPKPSQNLLLMKVKNYLQFLLMISGMLGVMSFLGFTIAGYTGVIIALAAAGMGFFFTSNFSIAQILRKKNVQLIHPGESPVLYNMAETLAGKANIEKMPVLFFDNTPEINAYTVEDKERAAIVISKGLINSLTKEEMYGVLAHEVAHLKNNDIQIMLFSEQIRKLTGYMAFFGQVLLILSLPLLFLNQIVLPWLTILLLMAAPTISFLFQVAMSRNREFRADMDAALLAGDASGLSRALKKISMQTTFWKKFYAPYLKNVPEILRTHPNTKARIQRLQELKTNHKNQLYWSF